MNINWNHIETVLLDMDGTLLDLHFDNFFWLSHLPRRYAEHHDLCPDQATIELHRRFDEKRGTLDWYCLEYWSEQLAVNIRQLKEEVQHLIQERPFVRQFLQQLGAANKQRILVTNAHPQSLQLKLAITGIDGLLDDVISSHSYGFPKEAPEFWQRLQGEIHFDPAKTLFIDDSVDILHAARRFGIKHTIAIRQPDSKLQPKEIQNLPSILHFDEILPKADISATDQKA